MTIYIQMLTKLLVMELFEDIFAWYTMMLVPKLEVVVVNEFNQKLYMNMFMLMA